MTQTATRAAAPIETKVTGLFGGVSAGALNAALRHTERAVNGAGSMTVTMPAKTIFEMFSGGEEITVNNARELTPEQRNNGTITMDFQQGLIIKKSVAEGAVNNGVARANLKNAPANKAYAPQPSNVMRMFENPDRPQHSSNPPLQQPLRQMFEDKGMASLLKTLVDIEVSRLKADNGVSAAQVMERRNALITFANVITGLDNVVLLDRGEVAYQAVLESHIAAQGESAAYRSTVSTFAEELGYEDNRAPSYERLRSFIPGFFNMLAANDKPALNITGRGGGAGLGMEAVTFDWAGIGVRADYAALRRLQQHVRFMSTMMGIDAEAARRADFSAKAPTLEAA